MSEEYWLALLCGGVPVVVAVVATVVEFFQRWERQSTGGDTPRGGSRDGSSPVEFGE